MLNILLIAIICVIVTDLTDFFDYVKRYIWNWSFNYTKPYTGFSFKLFDCSLCQTWWVSLLYLLISQTITLPLMVYALFIAYLTPVIKELILLLKDILIKLLDIIYKILKLN